MYATHPDDALLLAHERARELVVAQRLRRAARGDCPLVALLQRFLHGRAPANLAHHAT